MSESTIKGAIKLINPIKVISDKFSVREFVVTTPDEKYPQDILFQTVNDKMAVLESLGVGQQVEVSYNVRGREFNGRYYNTLDAWKIEVTGSKPSQPSTQPIELDDDLPFN
jgi:single-strand DNA-binding protein